MSRKPTAVHILTGTFPLIARSFLGRFFNIKFRTFVPTALVSLLLASVVVGKQSQKVTPLHHFQLPCVNCHQSELVDSADGLQEGENAGQVKGDINKFCTTLGCHDFDPFLNHPVGIRPKGTVPANMPLDNHSHITCLTCHNEPNSLDNPNCTDIGPERSLRRPTGMQFCSTCHVKMGDTMLEQSHWQFSTRAHLGSINPQAASSGDSKQLIGDIDTESRMCLTCHEDITVTIPAYNETLQQKRARWRKMKDHPIGIDYEHTALRKISRYNFPLINERIRLFNGKLGCGSCHSPYSQIKNNLVNPNLRGALCRMCHNK